MHPANLSAGGTSSVLRAPPRNKMGMYDSMLSSHTSHMAAMARTAHEDYYHSDVSKRTPLPATYNSYNCYPALSTATKTTELATPSGHSRPSPAHSAQTPSVGGSCVNSNGSRCTASSGKSKKSTRSGGLTTSASSSHLSKEDAMEETSEASKPPKKRKRHKEWEWATSQVTVSSNGDSDSECETDPPLSCAGVARKDVKVAGILAPKDIRLRRLKEKRSKAAAAAAGRMQAAACNTPAGSLGTAPSRFLPPGQTGAAVPSAKGPEALWETAAPYEATPINSASTPEASCEREGEEEPSHEANSLLPASASMQAVAQQLLGEEAWKMLREQFLRQERTFKRQVRDLHDIMACQRDSTPEEPASSRWTPAARKPDERTTNDRISEEWYARCYGEGGAKLQRHVAHPPEYNCEPSKASSAHSAPSPSWHSYRSQQSGSSSWSGAVNEPQRPPAYGACRAATRHEEPSRTCSTSHSSGSGLASWNSADYELSREHGPWRFPRYPQNNRSLMPGEYYGHRGHGLVNRPQGVVVPRAVEATEQSGAGILQSLTGESLSGT